MRHQSSMSSAALLTCVGANGEVMNPPNTSANDLAIKRGLNEMPEGWLISAAKAGDAIAFVELSKRHSHKILRRAYRIVKNWEDAEDVLQESLMRAFLHLKGFEERSSFSSWLTRIAINFSLMSLRKKRRYIEISMEVINDDHGTGYPWEPKDPAESPESHCSRREREDLLEGAIRRLPPHAAASSSDEPYRRSLRRRGFANSWHLCAGGQIETGAREDGTARIALLR